MKQNVDANDVNRKLRAAVAQSDGAQVVTAINDGADINAADSNGWTALMIAAKKGSEEIAKILLENGASPNAVNGFGKSIFDYALAGNHVGVVRLLLEHHLDVDQVSPRTGFSMSPISVVEYQATSPLISAADLGRSHIVSLLLDHGRTSTSAALSPDRINEALLLAARKSDLASAEALLNYEADPNTYNAAGVTPLMCAASNGSLPMINLLLTNGAEVNRRAITGDSALTQALASKRSEAASLLIERGADVTVKPLDGYTPLKYAHKNKMKAVARLLVSKGARE